MTGMRNRMSVARCCCDCEDCCNGAFPDEYELDLSLGADVCACTGISGTFTLAKVLNCNWQYDSGIVLSESCDPPYGADIVRQLIRLTIRCVNATQYAIELWVELLRAEADGCTGYSQLDDYYWGQLVNVADYSCTGAVDHHIPFVAKYDYKRIPGWPSCVTVTNTEYLCDPSADAIITAVP